MPVGVAVMLKIIGDDGRRFIVGGIVKADDLELRRSLGSQGIQRPDNRLGGIVGGNDNGEGEYLHCLIYGSSEAEPVQDEASASSTRSPISWQRL